MHKREPYYYDGDPNRLFPDGKPKKPLDPDKEPPSALEEAYAALFEHISVMMGPYPDDYFRA